MCSETVLRGSIDDPDEGLAALFEDGGRGHPENRALIVAEPCRDGASEPEACRRIIQGDADAAHARDGIGLRRDFANLALDLNGRKQLQADGERQTDGQGHREIRADIDHGLADVRPRHGHDTLTRRDHLSHVGAHGRDDTGEIGLHLRIAELLDRLGQVRVGAGDRCLGAGAHLLCVVQRLPRRGVGLDQDPFPLLGPDCVFKQGLALSKGPLSLTARRAQGQWDRLLRPSALRQPDLRR